MKILPQSLEHLATAALIPYARNARTHSPAQVAGIAGSIREFGFNNPVLIDQDNGIIAGHGRVLAAQQLGLETVPCLRLGHLTKTQRRAYILADNRLAELAGWDTEMLALEIADLRLDAVDVGLLGFDEEALRGFIGTLNSDEDEGSEGQDDDTYSKKITAPVYTPKGTQPALRELFNDSKAKQLRRVIHLSNVPSDIKKFLNIAADRHTIFHFRNIAEYYSHANQEIQQLFEQSALVIIDFNQAIENGFVALTEKLGKIADQEGWNGQDA